MQLAALPTELLFHLLSPLPTPCLLPLLRLSRQFHILILRILHHRLHLTTFSLSQSNRNLLLKAYHPAAPQLPLSCKLLGTDGLSREFGDHLSPCSHTSQYPRPDSTRDEGGDPACLYTTETGREDDDFVAPLKHLNGLYTRFRPTPLLPSATSSQRRHPAGDVPGSRTYREPAVSALQAERRLGEQEEAEVEQQPSKRKAEEEVVRQNVHLDAGELFTQLKAIMTLVRFSPGSGLVVMSAPPVGDGVVRVFRGWLREMVEARHRHRVRQSDVNSKGDNFEGVLWVNNAAQDIGIRFSVEEKVILRADPPLTHRDSEDEGPVTFEIQYQGLHHFLLAAQGSSRLIRLRLIRSFHPLVHPRFLPGKLKTSYTLRAIHCLCSNEEADFERFFK